MLKLLLLCSLFLPENVSAEHEHRPGQGSPSHPIERNLPELAFQLFTHSVASIRRKTQLYSKLASSKKMNLSLLSVVVLFSAYINQGTTMESKGTIPTVEL